MYGDLENFPTFSSRCFKVMKGNFSLYVSLYKLLGGSTHGPLVDLDSIFVFFIPLSSYTTSVALQPNRTSPSTETMINRKTIENKITQTFKYKSTIVVQIYVGTHD